VLLQQRVGFAVGDQLVPYFAWRGVPLSAARRVGLLRTDGRERLAGRIVFPEMRDRQPVWLIGDWTRQRTCLVISVYLARSRCWAGSRPAATDAASAWSRVHSMC
jgi:hypothetical protein